MAWRLQCLVWITAVTVTAQNYRGYDPLYHYIDNQSRVRTNDAQYTSVTRDVRIQNRSSQKIKNGTQSTLHINKRGGHRTDLFTILLKELYAVLGTSEASWSDKVVFPGPTRSVSYEPDVNEECQELGYCRHVSNYPKDHVKSLLKEIGDQKQWFQMDKFDIDVQIAQRLGGVTSDQTFELCNFTTEIVYPFSAQDRNNEWFQVINDEENPVQGFLAEKCNIDKRTKRSPCSKIVMFQAGYNASCVQKFVYRKVAAISKEDGKPVQMQLKLPSCCSCVAQSIVGL